VRRQSEAATALLLIQSAAASKAASCFACRRTPYFPQWTLLWHCQDAPRK